MATLDQTDEQCSQLLERLTRLVKSDIDISRENKRSPKEREYRRTVAEKRSTLINDILSNLVSQLNLSQNAYAPISVLVDELLVEIWSYLPTLDLFTVSTVCKRWRFVALDASRLWTDIDFDRLKRRQIELLLKRAKSSPLHISLTGIRSLPASWKHQLQSRRMRTVQRQSQSRGWCDRGVVQSPPYPFPYSPTPPLRPVPKVSPAPKEYDDEDSDYEYYNSMYPQQLPRYPFPPSFFDPIVKRARSLRATLGTNASFYVTYKTLAQPMPLLWRLSLAKTPEPYRPPGYHMAMQPFLVNEKETEYMAKPGTWFNGVTPNLRELDFAYIHAPWNDPIYSNLTRLRICLPDTRLKVSQLLRILRQCPSMEYLDLTECFSAPPRPGTSSLAFPPHPQVVQQQQIQALGVQGQALETIDDDIGKGLHRVDLPKLWYLQLQESVSASSSYILSYIICPRLETLALCAMGPSSIAANIRVLDESDGDSHIACRRHNQAFESISHLISNTTQLQFLHSNQNHASIIGRIDDDGVPRLARWAHQGDTIKKVPGKGWSFSYVSAPYQGNPQLATVPLSHSDRFRAALNHQVELLQQLDLAGVCYHLIEKIDLGGPALYIDTFYENLFSQCFNLKRLRLRTVPLTLTAPSPPPNFLPQAPLDIRPPPYKEAMSILDKVIADRLCQQLEEVHVSWFAASAEELADWVELRAFRVKRLKKVVVEVYEPVTQVFQPGLDDMGEESSKLDDKSKMRIEAALERTDDDLEPRFVWGNPERERMREVHEYYKETYGFKDRDEEMDTEMQS